MANIMLGFPNRIDGAALSGGTWVEALPLDNIKDRQFARVARSGGINPLDPAATTFTIDLGQQRSIRMFAIIAHNFSLTSRIRIEASNGDDFATLLLDMSFDTWGTVAGADWDINALEWENDNYWLGSYTMEDIEGLTPISSQIFPQNVVARYWRVTIFDQANTAGFVELGRIFLGESFLQPRVNYSFGASFGYEDATGVDTALSGAEFFDPREPVRVIRFSLGQLSEEEGFGQALELTRRAGIWKEVFVVPDPDDDTFGSVRNFIGRLRQLSPLEQAAYRLTSMPFEIKELR